MNEPTASTPEQTLWTGTVSHLHYAGKWFLIVILLGAAIGSLWLVFPTSANIPCADLTSTEIVCRQPATFDNAS